MTLQLSAILHSQLQLQEKKDFFLKKLKNIHQLNEEDENGIKWKRKQEKQIEYKNVVHINHSIKISCRREETKSRDDWKG